MQVTALSKSWVLPATTIMAHWLMLSLNLDPAQVEVILLHIDKVLVV